ncbi:ABC transporter ATP-binding protein [Agromyces sp. S2-1-8]|uniref:nickel ABC transporter ATP-binding protein NikE n=1 Tax=Agromyces sp. S2-1-8 TaxID=2897180 RepID=UPI001E30484A|nr:ABC transporter ATP-binding protein [Agromyces sp. S2-1-8]MCD5347101.1 ABC transporter ATP-binding protein [Agromyces sp. S2-1-8]
MNTTTRRPVLELDGLSVDFGDARVVDGVGLSIAPGECVALVGESGSGKSVTARSLLGMAGDGARVRADVLRIDGRDLRGATERDWRTVRGRTAGLVLQDALVALDPLRPVGREVEDALRIHDRMPRAERRARAGEVLDAVGMPDPATAARRRSGELSGGLRQRALIASALALDPPLLIADEPTTALDATVQARVLDLLAAIRDRGTGLLLISHDLAVVSRLADRVLVIREGRVLEQGATAAVLGAPSDPYTRQLIAAVPADVPRGVALSGPGPKPASDPTEPRTSAVPTGPTEPARGSSVVGAAPSDDHRGAALSAAPLLVVDRVGKSFTLPGRVRFAAVDDVSLVVSRGETVGLVGESGSGKTTLARLVLALTSPDTGTITFDGEPWSALDERARRPRRRRVGAIYQDALSSFDPRWTVGRILADADADAEAPSDADQHGVAASPTADRTAVRTGRARRIAELLDRVGLTSGVAHREPLTLSGGQRQRVAIARAIAARPDLLVCDEPVSALDVTIQAQILDLLDELQREQGLAMLFISHDLGVVGHMADRVAVMRAGTIVEQGPADRVLVAPEHPYTARLLADAPRLAH